MTENPNPRGWRVRGLFIDLGSVLLVTRQEDDTVLLASTTATTAPIMVTKVLFAGADGTYGVRLSDQEHVSLVNALEIYRSGR